MTDDKASSIECKTELGQFPLIFREIKKLSSKVNFKVRIETLSWCASVNGAGKIVFIPI